MLPAGTLGDDSHPPQPPWACSRRTRRDHPQFTERFHRGLPSITSVPHTSALHAGPLRAPLLLGREGAGSPTLPLPPPLRTPGGGLGMRGWQGAGKALTRGLGLGRTGGSQGAQDGARGAPGGRGGVTRLPQRAQARAAGAHHGHCGRKPAGAKGQAGGLRSRSSRGGPGARSRGGRGRRTCSGAALGFWLRTRKGARARDEGKARAAPGCALRSPLPPPSCCRRRAPPPCAVTAAPRPPPPRPPRARGAGQSL